MKVIFVLKNEPGGTSVKNLLHYKQSSIKNDFVKWMVDKIINFLKDVERNEIN